MNKKSVISSGVVVFLGILTLVVAYKSINDATKQKEEIIRLSEEKVAFSSPEPTEDTQVLMTDTQPIYYLLQSREKELKLYLVEKDIKKEIKSIKISEEMLPKEDIMLLKEGIKAMTLEEGVEIMENFIS